MPAADVNPAPDVLARLMADGLLRPGESGARTTTRWHAAMARAALRLERSGAPWRDLRLPIAAALVDLYAGLPEEEIARYVEVILPIEEAELPPLFGAPPPAGAR